MENTEFYIKYHTNHPVKVETHVNNERTALRLFPLITVGDLIAAYQVRPGSLLANTDSGLITLHSFNNEVETSYNSWDPLTVLGKNGTTGTSPLIIKSKNDAVGVNEVVKKKVNFEESFIESLKSLKYLTLVIEPLVQNFIKKFYYTNDTRTKVSRGDKFKKELLTYYYAINERVDEVKCMISGIFLPSRVVIAGHLYKFCWADSCEERLDFSDIDNPRNGLLMFKPFEFAFDNSHICFQYDSITGLFKLKILYPKLRDFTIREYIRSENEIDERSLLKSREDWITELNKTPEAGVPNFVNNLLEILDKPFSDFEGTPVLSGSEENKCFGRCLSFQASMAQNLAVSKKWISIDEVSSPMFSQLGEKKKDQIMAWISDFSNGQFLPTVDFDE